MRIDLQKPRAATDTVRYSGNVFINEKNSYRIYFDTPNQSAINESAQQDAFFLLGNIFASKLRIPLEYPYGVSPLLMRNAGKVLKTIKIDKPIAKKIYHDMKVALHKGITRSRTDSMSHTPKKRGQFFTLGIDSFYTLLCSPKKVDYLLYVDGYDIPLVDTKQLTSVHTIIKKVAKATGKKAVFIRTNAREVADKIIAWESFDGAALAMCAYFAGGSFREVYNNNNWGYDNNKTKYCGMGVHIDPYFSTEYMKLLSCGENETRYEKAFVLSKSPHFDLVLKYIRPCWENDKKRNGMMNCSVCEKCIRTYLSLAAVSGKLDIPAFPGLNIKVLRKIEPCIAPGVLESFTGAYNGLLKRFGANSDIVRETKRHINRYNH